VPDVLTPAPSARSKCRGCGATIAKGEIRFGEALPNAFAEGEMTHWYHLACAACMRPEKLLGVLTTSDPDLPDRDWLKKTAEVGLAHRRLPRLTRAERSPSSRAACRSCRQPIEKGTWRLALSMFEDGRLTPIGSIHIACSEAYFDTKHILDRIERLCPLLGKEDLAEIGRILAEAKPPPAVPAEEAAGPAGDGATPGDGAPEDA